MLDNGFEVVWLVGFVAGCVIRARWTLPYRKQTRQTPVIDRRMTWLEWPLLALAGVGMQVVPLLYLFTSWLDFADYHLPRWFSQAVGWTGAVTFAAALWLLWRSHADLGRNWSAMVEVRKGQSLVTEGVYRTIRHPMYAAHWLWAVAQALLLQNWVAGPAFLVVFLALYPLRVPREERMMLDQFGDNYRWYVKRTGRLIPRLRR